ncbi:hypothetical protein [Lishizhenia sp.]|uniref:hypothetical protein n=1 Tax=Lishizhenia sp. TaxID=2497594 RepID=UPI00299CE5C4|nr:hypothetical protein [Lishizhenia sp.]MDX1447193.1 hypothetical protein [Lishizhenia sp.]
MNELIKIYKQQPVVVQIVVAIILLVIGWNVYNWAKAQMKNSAEETQGKVEIKQLEKQGVTPSYSDSDFDAMADDLEEAMTGPSNTDDANQVYSVLKKLKNDADFIQLNKAFGLRSSSWDFINPTATDLSTWLRDESLVDVSVINSQLSFQGLSKRF